MKSYQYLIIGGGMAADAAVKGIRQIDSSGTIGILSADPDPPYARPPLSKGLWKDDKSLDDIWMGTDQKGAQLELATRAVSLNAGKKEVVDDRGGLYRYERLLLATGGTPRHLSIGADDRVIYYRTTADYRKLRDLTADQHHFAVLGGGFIGSEIAAALNSNDKQVTMVFPEATICGLVFPKEFGEALNHYYEEHGVTVVSGSKPCELSFDRGTFGIQIENGHKFSADAVVAGIGITPQTELASKAGLAVDDGIIVDERLRTRNPDIFAAGDVARFYNPLLEKRMRVEHEDNALSMGETAGRNMAGQDEAYHHLPFFYSDLFDVGYEAVGDMDSSLETITRLKKPEEKGCIFYLSGERVRGVVFWNVFGKVDAGRELIAAPGPHSAGGLKEWEQNRLSNG